MLTGQATPTLSACDGLYIKGLPMLALHRKLIMNVYKGLCIDLPTDPSVPGAHTTCTVLTLLLTHT